MYQFIPIGISTEYYNFHRDCSREKILGTNVYSIDRNLDQELHKQIMSAVRSDNGKDLDLKVIAEQMEHEIKYSQLNAGDNCFSANELCDWLTTIIRTIAPSKEAMRDPELRVKEEKRPLLFEMAKEIMSFMTILFEAAKEYKLKSCHQELFYRLDKTKPFYELPFIERSTLKALYKNVIEDKTPITD